MRKNTGGNMKKKIFFSQFCERARKKHHFPQTRRVKCFNASVINVLAMRNTNHQEKSYLNV
jgi:hypothetical protein